MGYPRSGVQLACISHQFGVAAEGRGFNRFKPRPSGRGGEKSKGRMHRKMGDVCATHRYDQCS
jgi:hypothetical protein